MVAFVALAAVTIWLDRNPPTWIGPVRDLIEAHLFREAETTNAFLGMATTGLITMTSITFSMLLLALQQSASLIGAQVVNSFLLRKRNQTILGLFLGSTLFVLVVHAAAHDGFNPAPRRRAGAAPDDGGPLRARRSSSSRPSTRCARPP